MIDITETDIDNGVPNSELIHTNTFSVFRCERDYSGSRMKRGSGVCLAIDSFPNPIDLDIKNSTDFKNLHLIDIIGVRFNLKHFSCQIFLIYTPPRNSSITYSSILELLRTFDKNFSSNILITGDTIQYHTECK